MKSLTSLCMAGTIAILLLVAPHAADAQIKNSGPMSIIIAYKSPPEKRAAFRAHMETVGVRQFEQWKNAGVFKDYQMFGASFAGQRIGNLDVAVILDFTSFAETARWKAIDKRMPGGLSPAALALGHAEHLTLVYAVGHGAAKVRNRAKAAYVLGLYEAVVDDATYIQYARGYVEPQMKGWLEEGAMSAYTMYIAQPGQNPTAAPFTFLLAMEYTDMASLAHSDVIKEKVRERLKLDPVWKAFSDDKGTKRKARGFVLADAILVPTK